MEWPITVWFARITIIPYKMETKLIAFLLENIALNIIKQGALNVTKTTVLKMVLVTLLLDIVVKNNVLILRSVQNRTLEPA